ncbi:MAG: multidrug efflux SMR transporter [Paludibacteraceae bacterium]|nr:multidrug efflux SMR transporter [Prevotella sp.]MBQ8152207.1 multidrug efflux SMR transporter [Prevotella sp.]MBQ8706150.1 multidrug efflux SMR transporter [Paludibacteraceae bacterium]MBQ8714561.1 multidrug efflux SMR transporter [Prevotella sp.]
MKEWIFLFIAIVSETFGTVMLKYAEQFTRLWPSLATLIGYLLSFYFLALALRTIPVGLAYAIWGAIGIVLVLIISAVLFKQTPDLPAIIGIILIIAGIVIINFFSKMQVD